MANRRKQKSVKQIAAEQEAEQLEKMVYKYLVRMDELQTRIDELEAAR